MRSPLPVRLRRWIAETMARAAWAPVLASPIAAEGSEGVVPGSPIIEVMPE